MVTLEKDCEHTLASDALDTLIREWIRTTLLLERTHRELRRTCRRAVSPRVLLLRRATRGKYVTRKPIAHLLGKGMTADMLTDDCLGRTLDWLSAHDSPRLFAGRTHRARQIFGISTT